MNTATLHRIRENSFAFKRKNVLPMFAAVVCWLIIVLVTGLSLYYFLPVLLLLLACERRITHNAYFANLDNRVFMNDEGETFLEITPHNRITKFLDSSIRFRIENRKIVSFAFERKIIHEKRGRVAKDIRQLSGRYLIKLPVLKPGQPVKTRFVNGDKLHWKLMLRYPRKLLPDLVYKLDMSAEYRVNDKEVSH